MQLSEILKPIPTEQQLSELFPSERKGRPRVNTRDLQVLYLWLKGYSATAIAEDIEISVEGVAAVVRTTKYRLLKSGVEIDVIRVPLHNGAHPLTSEDDDVRKTIYVLVALEQLRKARSHQRELAIFIYQYPGLETVLCQKLHHLNQCKSKELYPSQRKDGCIKCIIEHSDYLV